MERQGLRALESGADRDAVESALFEIKRVIAGQDEMLERVFVCLLAGGHLLIEGVPGLAKTLTIKTVADVLGGTFQRVQFTPDLVPSDLVGTRMYRGGKDGVRHRARPRLLQLPARGRDQPRAGEGAVGAARGDAGAPGDDRQRDARGAVAVPRHGDAEPDRVRGHLPAARGAGRPLHAQGARRLPGAGGRADRDRARARRAGRRRAAALGRGSRRAAGGDAPRLRRPSRLPLRALDRDSDAPARRDRASRSSTATSSTAPARAGRSTSSSAPARSRSCAVAATPSPRTCASSPRTCSATGWCSATRRSPKESTPSGSSTEVLETIPMPQLDLSRQEVA